MNRRNGFTLVELLAVIVILAIILAISMPTIRGLIDNSMKSSFQSNAKLIYKAIENKRLENSDFNPTTINKDNIYEVLKISSNDYESVTVSIKNNRPFLSVVGTNRWNNLIVCGTYHNMTLVASLSDCSVPLADNSGASAPNLRPNMIPIRWNGADWIKADSNNEAGDYSWYDYDTKMWANAVTVTEATRTSYQNAALGTVVNAVDILTFFVWVPRYKYAIPTGTGPREINIVFESKISPKSTGTAVDTDYYTHPAFTFGATELDGIWVGKFEPTGTIDSITIVPGLTSIRSQMVSTMFSATRAMQNAGNQYGFETSGIDTHVMKNSEWGATAYLSHSKYGKNAEVTINAAAGYYTGGGTDTSYITNINQSTTGTIYGIYDMSGGGLEYVMGNYNDTGVDSIPDPKYYDKYTTTDITTTCDGGICKGHALSETSGWYDDYTNFASMQYPWVRRGGGYNAGINAGAFCFDNVYRGGGDTGNSFRIVLN